MGIDVHTIKAILTAQQLGASLRRTIMIGRQELQTPPHDVRRVLEQFSRPVDDAQLQSFYSTAGGYAEPLLRFLGAERIESLDKSPFESATCLHDLNEPIPAAWHEQYDLVLDGGALEHVFNFPVAVRNCMELVCAGGFYLGITPTNGYSGHGFYQFSPELYFRVFSADNGFSMRKLLVYETDSPRWYEVVNPAEVGCRVKIPTRRPTLMVVCAQREAIVPIFAKTPQQSDYDGHWARHASTGELRTPRIRSRPAWQRGLRQLKKALRSPFRGEFLRPVD